MDIQTGRLRATRTFPERFARRFDHIRDSGAVRSARRRLSGRRVRACLLLLAMFLFLGGAVWSFRSLGLAPDHLRLAPLVVLGGLILPSLLYGGIGLILLARSAGLTMTPGRATVISAHAYLAELLPVPGGAIVRARALISAGGTLKHSSLLVIGTAVLWVALAMIGAGFTLLSAHASLAWPLLAIGFAFSATFLWWLASSAGSEVALQTLVHRIAGIGLTGLRLKFAFLALGMPIAFSDTLPFVLASLLGSASSIAPAGLGISESLAALAATTSSYPSGVAFLAVGIDRLFCLAGCALVALAAYAMPQAKGRWAHVGSVEED